MAVSASFNVPYAVGNNVSVAAVTPASVNATGGVTLGTLLDLHSLAVFDSGRFNGQVQNANIKPADATIANYVYLYDDWTFELGEIAAAGQVSYLEAVWRSVFYVRCQMRTTNPWSTAGFSNFTVIGGRDTIERGWVEDKQGVILTLKPVGILPEWTTGTPSF